MDLRGAERGQSVQIGAVLLFGVLVILFATYQAFVVPQQNAQIEGEHQQVIDRQMQELRNTIVSIPSTHSDRAVTLTLGTAYPARAIAVNPGPPSGSIRSVGTGDREVNVTLANARAIDNETADFWDGTTDRSYNTGQLTYVPNYNEYQNPPTIVYENTLLYEEFRDGNISVTGQRLVDGKQLTLVTLNGSLDRASSESVSLDVEAVSASDRQILIRNETAANVTLNIVTQRDASAWRELLADDEQYTDQSGHVVRGGVTETPLPNQRFDIVNIELQRGIQYRLKMAKVGIGSRVTEEGTAYLTAVSGDRLSVNQGATREVTVEVRDEYNNPVPSVEVFGEAESGSLDQTSKKTDIHGQATFIYNSTGVSPGSDNTRFSTINSPDTDFNGEAAKNITMTITVQESGDSDSGDITPPSFTYGQAGAQRNGGGNSVEYVDFHAQTSDNTQVDRVEVRVFDKNGNQIGSGTFGANFDDEYVTVSPPQNMQGSGNYISVELTAFDTSGNSRTCSGTIQDLYEYIDTNSGLSCDQAST